MRTFQDIYQIKVKLTNPSQLPRVYKPKNFPCGIILAMEAKDKADLIAKEAEIAHKKTVVYLAIAGGSWIYGVKEEGLIAIAIYIAFSLSTLGVVNGLFKVGRLEKEIKDLKND